MSTASNIAAPSVQSYGVLLLCLVTLIASWLWVRHEQINWHNIPEPPSRPAAKAMLLGDEQFSYRTLSLAIQNMGEVAGKSVSLRNYNYNRLTNWMYLLGAMDPHSNFVPFLASYYFSNVQDPDKLRHLVEFLAHTGEQPGENKWRWLGQAIAIARFDMNDQALALELAQELAAIGREQDLPAWTLQMPAFIMREQGDKQGAYELMFNILQSSADTLPPEELFFTRDYICARLLTPVQARSHPLCEYMKKGR